ncbi:hypothetical protein PIB30_111824, partial [Stylosanthes scabra]|nr:hypothetical protein [Stylosanthes scabra]
LLRKSNTRINEPFRKQTTTNRTDSSAILQDLAVIGISEAVIGLAWLGWSHWNSGLEEEGLL